MPKNGVAVVLPCEPPSTPTGAMASPGVVPGSTTPTGIEILLGTAMADACEALGAGLADYDAGGLSNINRTRGGVTIAAVVELWLAHFGAFDFGAVALTEGKRILHARHDPVLRQQGSDAVIDDVFGELLSHILAVATKVCAIERVFREH
jgi:hypothetical protein